MKTINTHNYYEHVTLNNRNTLVGINIIAFIKLSYWYNSSKDITIKL